MLKLTRNQSSKFANDIYNLYKDDVNTDFTFYCANGAKVKVHSLILMACSRLFLDMLKECQEEIKFTKLMNSEDIVRKLVDLIYLGSITGSEEELVEVSNLAKIYSIDITENYTESFQTALNDTFKDDHVIDDSDNTPDELEEVIDISSGTSSNNSSRSSICLTMEQCNE